MKQLSLLLTGLCLNTAYAGTDPLDPVRKPNVKCIIGYMRVDKDDILEDNSNLPEQQVTTTQSIQSYRGFEVTTALQITGPVYVSPVTKPNQSSPSAGIEYTYALFVKVSKGSARAVQTVNLHKGKLMPAQDVYLGVDREEVSVSCREE